MRPVRHEPYLPVPCPPAILENISNDVDQLFQGSDDDENDLTYEPIYNELFTQSELIC